MVEQPPSPEPGAFVLTPLIARPARSAGPDVAILRVTAGQDILRFTVVGDVVELGRDAACALSLSDSSVSRRHARVHVAAGVTTLVDLGSRNGTFVNGRRIDGEGARLSPGDRVEVGTVPLRFDVVSPDELAHLRGVVERLAAGDHDPLTGLLTRAYLEDRLPAVVEESDRAGSPLSAVFVDVDHFKSINDRLGHAVGDDVLRQVARVLAYAVRAGEVCVRYGGEEIVVVLAGANESHGVVMADRLRQLVESHQWSVLGEGLAVTVSCGVAQWETGESVRQWLERADRAVYAAKGRGRNSVCRASGLDAR